MKPLTCSHCTGKLQEVLNPKSGTYYQCKLCGCAYRLVIVTNNQDCWTKRNKTVKKDDTPNRPKHTPNPRRNRSHKRPRSTHVQ